MKGIIIVDVPECCGTCKMGFNNECSDEFECFMEPTKRLENPESEKPDWCPVKPILGRKAEETKYQNEYEKGWNSCIDEILKE